MADAIATIVIAVIVGASSVSPEAGPVQSATLLRMKRVATLAPAFASAAPSAMRHEPLPRPSVVEAAVRLLGDDDPGVVQACADRLIGWGESSRRAIERAARDSDPRVRVRARALLRTLTIRTATDAFVAAVTESRR